MYVPMQFSFLQYNFVFAFLLSGQKTAENSKKEEFVCPIGFGNGNFADPATCRRFYQVKFVLFVVQYQEAICFFELFSLKSVLFLKLLFDVFVSELYVYDCMYYI